MSNKPVLAFDADSVLLDWFFGFLSFLKQNGHCIKHVEEFVGTTQFVPTEEITKNDCKIFNKGIMKEFANSGYLSDLSKFQENGREILEELNEHFDFVVVTCIGETEDIVSQRKENLMKRYGDVFLEVICIDYGKSKEHPLRELSEKYNIVAFIDDRVKHLEEAELVGIKSILMSRGVQVCSTVSSRFSVISCLGEIFQHVEEHLDIKY